MVEERRLLLRRRGRDGYDPWSLDDYLRDGGYEALKKALDHGPRWAVNEVSKSRIRGRGGAGFHAGFKWESVAMQREAPKYLIANFDEGEEGTIKDRTIVETDPYLLIEGMTIAAYAMGIEKGFIYNRGEYPFFPPRFEKAMEAAREKKLLGRSIMGREFNFDMEVVRGAGAYVCGESSAILESIMGRAGKAKIKIRRTSVSGVFHSPTCVNNVETLSNVPYIIMEGGETYRNIGTTQSTGTRIVSLTGHVKNPGAYEVEMGKCTVWEIIDGLGGGVDGSDIKAVLLGGASGSLIRKGDLDLNYTMEDAESAGLTLGSGVIVVFNEKTCMVDMVHNLMGFFAHESCGKCTPCRTGTHHLLRIMEGLRRGQAGDDDLVLAKRIADTMCSASICGLGKTASVPLTSAIQNFQDEFNSHIRGECPAGRCPMGGGGR
ncbi:MAG: complex I 51 kDa subunit family protein [Thermoplasmatota archaeon]